jgi:hypothetical protein
MVSLACGQREGAALARSIMDGEAPKTGSAFAGGHKRSTLRLDRDAP